MEEELFKMLIYFQRIQVLTLEGKNFSSIDPARFGNYQVFNDEQNRYLLKFPSNNEIMHNFHKYVRILNRSKTSDTKPEGSLFRYRGDFSMVRENFYEWSDDNNVYLLNKYAEVKRIESEKDLVEEPGRNWLGDLPEYPIHEVLIKYGKISLSILKELSNYYKYLNNEIYIKIIYTINSLLFQITESAPYEDKIETTLTAAQLALLFRLLGDSNALTFDYKNDLYRKVAKYFTSKKSADLSVANIKNNFEKPDPNAQREIRVLLTEMQRILLEMR